MTPMQTTERVPTGTVTPSVETYPINSDLTVMRLVTPYTYTVDSVFYRVHSHAFGEFVGPEYRTKDEAVRAAVLIAEGG